MLGMLLDLTWAMDLTMQEKAVQAYRGWFHSSPAVNFQDGIYNDVLLNWLRNNVNSMRIIDVGSSETHRHFVVPLHVRGRHRLFGMPYASKKNYFVAFRSPVNTYINPENIGGVGAITYTAIFDGIGVINGVNLREATRKFGTEIRTHKVAHYGIILHIP